MRPTYTILSLGERYLSQTRVSLIIEHKNLTSDKFVALFISSELDETNLGT